MSKQESNALVETKDIKGTVVVLSKTQPQQLFYFRRFSLLMNAIQTR